MRITDIIPLSEAVDQTAKSKFKSLARTMGLKVNRNEMQHTANIYNKNYISLGKEYPLKEALGYLDMIDKTGRPQLIKSLDTVAEFGPDLNLPKPNWTSAEVIISLVSDNWQDSTDVNILEYSIRVYNYAKTMFVTDNRNARSMVSYVKKPDFKWHKSRIKSLVNDVKKTKQFNKIVTADSRIKPEHEHKPTLRSQSRKGPGFLLSVDDGMDLLKKVFKRRYSVMVDQFAYMENIIPGIKWDTMSGVFKFTYGSHSWGHAIQGVGLDMIMVGKLPGDGSEIKLWYNQTDAAMGAGKVYLINGKKVKLRQYAEEHLPRIHNAKNEM